MTTSLGKGMHMLILTCSLAQLSWAAAGAKNQQEPQAQQRSKLVTVKKRIGIPSDALLTALTFDRDRKIGIAVGGIKGNDPGTILRTTDGGKTWSQYQTAKGARLYGAANVTKDVKVVVGLAGRIFRSVDRGATWSLVREGKEWLSGVAFSSSSMGFAIGASGGHGCLLRTKDGGKTWKSHPGFPPNCRQSSLRAIRFKDNKNGVIVGTDGAIMTTTNGGTTWTGQVFGKGYLRGIAFQGRDGIWISGGPGVLLNSANFGRSWETKRFINGDKLNSMDFANDRFGWITSMSGHLYETSDGGAHWQSVFTEKGKHLTGFLAPAPGRSGFVVGSDACVLEIDLRRERVLQDALTQFKDDGGLAAYRAFEASVVPDPGRQAISFYFFAAKGAIQLGFTKVAEKLIRKFEEACRDVPEITSERVRLRSTELRKEIKAEEMRERKRTIGRIKKLIERARRRAKTQDRTAKIFATDRGALN